MPFKKRNEDCPCEKIEDPVVRHLCEWCIQRDIPVTGEDSISFWLDFEAPTINRCIPIKARRDGKYIVYRFDYKELPVLKSSSENNPNIIEEYIDTLEYFLNDVVADPLFRFTIREIDGKRIARGKCWVEVNDENIREHENNLLLVIRHAILVISKADNYFENNYK